MSVPDANLYEQLKAGILKIYEHSTTNEERQSIGQQLEAFKARPEAPQYGIHMARTEQDQKLYFFGLDVVARTVKTRWNEYPEAQKSSMRRFLLSMLTECVNFRFSQEHAGREKFAAALVEIVKRDWPQAWPEFEGTVLQVLERGPVQASVVCKVLRVVLEDVGDSDFNLALPSSRRADITRGLGDMAARGLFAAFERLLHTVISTLSGSPNAETAARFSLAGNEILGVISRFLASSMLSRFRDTRLTAAIAAAMRLPSLAIEACRCVSALAEGGGGTKTTDEKKIARKCLQDLAPVLPSVPLQPSPELLDFHKALSRALSLLASTYFSYIIMPSSGASRDSADDPGRKAILHCLLCFLQHPSILVASITVPVWISIAAHPDATASVEAAYIPIMEQVAQRLVQDPEGAPRGPDSEYNTVDFLSTAEWQGFFTQFRSRLTVALRHATAQRPATLANALQAIGSAVHRRVAAIGGADVNDRGDLTPASEPARLLEAYATFVDAVCAGLPFAVVKSKPPQAAAQGRGRGGKGGKKKKKKGQPPQPKGAPSVDRANEVDEGTYHTVRRSLSTVVQAVVSLDARYPTVVRLQCKCIASLSKFVQSDTGMLLRAAQLCVHSVIFRSKPEVDSSLPVTRMFSATCSARRAALTALRALCTGSPASLVKEYDGLASTLLQASRAGQLLASENTVLAESLVLLAHAISDKDKRTASLQALIKDPIDRAVALYQRLQSPDALLAELDVGGGGQGLEGRMHRASLRAALLSTLAGSEAVIRQLQLRGSAEVTQILAQVWPLVLPGALRTLGAFCFLWESGKKAELLRNPASAGLFVVSRAAVRSMAGSVDEVEEAPEGWAEMVDALSGDAVSPDSAVLRGADPGNEAEVAAVADWTAKFLSTTVSAIRAACVVRKGRPAPAFQTPEFTGGIRTYLEPALPAISHIQLRTVLINVYLPLLIACPAERVHDTLMPLIQPVIEVLLSRVQEIWAARAAGNAVSTAPILPPFVEEEARPVVLSNADVELTRFAMELCAVMCCCDTSDTPSIARVAPIENACTPARALAMSNPTLAHTCLRMLLGAFQVPDHATARTAVTAMQRLLQDQSTHNPLVQYWDEIFRQTVMALVKPPKHLHAAQWMLLHLAKEIYLRLCLGLKPRPSKLPHQAAIVTEAPRRILLGEARVPEGAVRSMEQTMRQSGNSKKVRDAFKDALQSAMDAGLAQAVGAEPGNRRDHNVLKVNAEGHASIRDLPDKYVMMTGNHEQAPAVLENPAFEGGELAQLFYLGEDEDDDDI